VFQPKLPNKLRNGKAIRVSNKTYNELAKRGNLTDSFDSVISNLLKKSNRFQPRLTTSDPKQTAISDNEPQEKVRSNV